MGQFLGIELTAGLKQQQRARAPRFGSRDLSIAISLLSGDGNGVSDLSRKSDRLSASDVGACIALSQ